MAVLSSLLPGLRDLRAPLAAGYLWLAALWLAIGAHVSSKPPPPDSKSLQNTIYRAWEHAGSVGQATALTFAAYLVGSASSEAGRRLLDGLALIPIWPQEVMRWRFGNPQARGSERGEVALFAWLMQWTSDNLPITKGVEEGGEMADKERNHRLAQELAPYVWTDLGALHTQLLLTAPRLADDIERRRSEGEFRLAIGPPLLAVLVVLVADSSFALWTTALALLAATLVASLVASGWVRLRSANDALMRQLIDGVITAPVLDDRAKRERLKRDRDAG